MTPPLDMDEASRKFAALLDAPGGYDAAVKLFDPPPHVCLIVPTVGQLRGLVRARGYAGVVDVFRQRREAIERERADPYRYGWRPDCWKDADELLAEVVLLAIFGGNRSSKTTYGAYSGVRKLVEKPGSIVLWLHESGPTSIDVQQKEVFKFLPPEWKRLRKTNVTNISYSQKNGFTENKFVLPNGSMGVFGSYKQDIGDYEGLEFDQINADEGLPLNWLRTLLFRLATRAGKMIWSYTPLHGITPAVKEVVEGATTVQSLPAELLPADQVHVPDCPAGHMPYIQTSTWPRAKIIYFHSKMNPFGGYATIKQLLEPLDRTQVERRAYGYARNTIRTLFPLFGAHNIIRAAQVPAKLTRYLLADPASARNMFLTWWGVDARGHVYIYREWPDEIRHGAWAEASEVARLFDGQAGPAQPTLGYGVTDYKRLIMEEEGHHWDLQTGWRLDGETIEQRLMDSRAGRQQSIADNEGGSALFDRFREEHVDRAGLVDGPMVDFIAAPGLNEDTGIMAINDLLAYNPQQPITAHLNEPRLHIVETCTQTIWALKNYTKHDGEKAACKDPIDNLRYGATAQLYWNDANAVISRGGGSYG